MNKIYKVIWSKAKHTYVVASEIAKGHTKGETTGKGLKKLAAAMLVAAALLSPSFAWAADGTVTVKDTSDKEQTVYTEEGAKNTFATIENLSTVSTEVQTQATQVKTNATNIDGLTTKVNALETADKNSVTEVTGSDAKLTIKKGDGSTSEVTIDNVNHAASADSATKATQDGDGNVISTTYATKTEVKEADEKLDSRITAVKEFLQTETEKWYVSKDSLASELEVKAAGVVKEDQTIGENVSALGKALYDETNARIWADKSQDKRIDDAAAGIASVNNALATQVDNLNKQDANEAAARVAADTELNERITNEANAIHDTTHQLRSDLNTETTAREDADTALDTRITNVKEYVLSETNKNYVSKTDAAVQDGAVVKAANTIGENVANLDAALDAEKNTRIWADKTQDKVIQQVNQNMVDGFNTINKNMSDGFTALNQADAALDEKITAETAGRVAADTKLVKAMNSGLSLSEDNVLQKDTTTIDAQGNVTPSKTDANEMILNKDNDNRITMNEKGIKVGTNSSVMDKDGVYTGGDNYTAAQAAMSADGSIKGADGKFTVDGTTGDVSTNGTLTAASGTIGNVSMSADGTVTGVKDLTASGKVTAGSFTDGTATMSNGSLNGVNQINATGNIVTTGNMKAHDITAEGTIKGETIYGTTGTFGSLTTTSNASVGGKLTANGITNTGNAITDTLTVNHNATVGGDLGVTGNITGKSLNVGTGDIKGGQITGTGLDVGAGTIKTTGAVETGTLTTTGDADIGGNLTVDKNLTVNGEFNAKTLSSRLDENNYTTINGGKTESVNLKIDVKTHETQASASTFDETGSNAWAKDDDSIGESSMTADKISQSLSDTGDNTKNIASRELSQNTDNKYEITDSVVEGNQSNVENRTADTTDSQISLKDDSGKVLNKSYITQNLKKVLMGVEEGGNKTTIEQDANNITNTAENGTISNSAKDLVNTASENMTNNVGKNLETTVGGEMKTTVTGKVTEDFKSDLTTTIGGNKSETVAGTSEETVTGKKTETYGGLETTVNGDEKHTVSGSQTNEITGSQTNTIGGDQTTTVTGDSSLTAENISNEAKNKITNKALDVETDASSSIVNKVSNEYGSNTSTQLSYQTTEEMSQADGKTASYLRGAAEGKSQLTDGAKKTTIDTIAGQTNTNITDGKNISNSLQKADQVASSVTDGTNSTVVDQKAGSLASSITDGTKVNNTNNTVDKSEQLIKTDDTHYYAETKTAGSAVEALKSDGNTIIIGKDAAAATVSSAVTDGASITGISQNAKDINLSAAGGTIANSAKNISNIATEKLSNSAAEIENTATKSITDKVGKNTSWEMTDGKVVESVKDESGKTNQTTTTAADTYQFVKDGDNTLAKRTSSTNDNLNITDGTNTYTKITTATGNKQTVTDGAETASTNLTKSASNTLIENGTQSVLDHMAADTSYTVMNENGNGSRRQQTASEILDRVTDGTDTSEVKQTASEVATSAKDISNTATEKITSQIGDGSAVKSEMTADSITNITGNNTVTSNTKGTTFENKANSTAIEEGTVTKTTISGNTLETGKATMDYAEVMKDLGVRGNAVVDGTSTLKGDVTMESNASVGKNLTVNGDTTMKGNASVGKDLTVAGTSTLTGDVTMENNASVGKNLTVKGDTEMVGNATVKKNLTVEGETNLKNTKVDGTLNVTGSSEFDGKATFNDIVTMNKGLSVTGGVTADTVTAKSFKVGENTYIDENGINANNRVIKNVGQGDISEGSTDAVSGGQLYETNTRVSGLETRMGTVETKVDKLDNKIDKVGANAAAMANLHPLEFDEDSKWNIAAAVGSSGSETASAVGVFYRPNENVMVNASAAMGTGENMFGGGVSLRLGHGGNKAKEAQMKAAAKENRELRAKVDDLTARMDALLSVLNPNMSKDFPDVPENHWAYEAVSRLAGNGIVEGYEDGKYHGERQMTRYEMAEIIYNALSKGAKAEKKLVEEFRPELQAMAAQKRA